MKAEAGQAMIRTATTDPTRTIHGQDRTGITPPAIAGPLAEKDLLAGQAAGEKGGIKPQAPAMLTATSS